MKKLLLRFNCLVWLALSMACGYADEETPLVGHLSSVKEEVASATDIVIGKFTKVTVGGTASMNGMDYHGTIIISQALKGTESGSLEVGFRVIPASKDKEVEPNLEDTYIMFLIEHHGIRKLLLATDANIATMKALIAAAPATKSP
jgi:hypothetical protein